MEEEYKKDKSPLDSPVEPKIYDPFSEEENEPKEKTNKQPYEEGPKMKEESTSGGYNVRDPKNEGNKSAEGKTDLKKGPFTDMFSRETQKNKPQFQYQNSQNDGNPYKATYPELYQRMEKESEMLIHFYVKNISSFHHKNEIYRKLYDALQQFGAVKEISLQRVNNDVYDFGVGMKYDEVAKYVFENDKLHSFITSLDHGNIKPYIECSLIFNFFLKSTPTEKSNYDPRKEGKQSISSQEPHRRSGGYGQSEEDQRRGDRNQDKDSAAKDREHDKRSSHKSPAATGSAYGKKGRHGEDGSRSRSRSKSPSGRQANQVDKKQEYDPSKVYQVKDFIAKKKPDIKEIPANDKADLKASIESVLASGQFQYTSGRSGQSSVEKPLMPSQRPEKPGPPSGQPGGGDHSAFAKDSATKSFNPPPFYQPPTNFQDQNIKTQLVTTGPKESAKGQASQVQPTQVIAVPSAGAEPVIDYDNYCLFLGVPSELTEQQIFDSLKAQGIELPIKCEWVDESVTQYLRLGFKSDKTVKELILRDITVGPTLEDLIYPILILPWLKDKKFDDLLVYHQVQVESSIPVDSLFLDLFYSPYGPIADVIDMKPSKHVLIFTKQPHAQHVLSIPQISLQKNNIEIVMKHTVVDSCYPLVRKNLEAHQQTLMARYIKTAKPSSLASAAVQEVVEEEQKLDPIYQSPPHHIHREGVSSTEKYDSQYEMKGLRYPNEPPQEYSPNYRYEDEGYYITEKDRGGNRPQFGGQPYRQDKFRYNNDRMQPRNDFRRDNQRNDRNQGYNPRFNQGQRDGGEGYGGPGGRPYNNYQQQQYGRNQEPRQHQYHRQNISPESRGQYHQGRNPDMRSQERGLDYRGHPGKGHDQRQQPLYPK